MYVAFIAATIKTTQMCCIQVHREGGEARPMRYSAVCDLTSGCCVLIQYLHWHAACVYARYWQ